MKPLDKFKLCSQCDGRIPIEVVICPYCSATLNSQDPQRSAPLRNLASSENLASLYTPPYAAQRIQPTSALEEKKRSISPQSEPKVTTLNSEAPQSEEKSEILPISLLVIGSNLLVISVMQLILSDNGLLKLEWDARYWYIYAIISAPLLWLGIKTLRKTS
jgi:hypothetical protein